MVRDVKLVSTIIELTLTIMVRDVKLVSTINSTKIDLAWLEM